LCNRQNGFYKALSWETQLCGTYHDISRHVDKGYTIHGVVLDLAKAFDKVPHKLLMQRLYNISNVST